MDSRRGRRIAVLSEALSQHRILHIKNAAEILGVSEMTVRRDVSANADQFAFLGGHIVPAIEAENDPYEISKAADSHAAAKRQVCTQAVDYIHHDDTVFFDCGTTLPYLVDLLPDQIHITAICYAMNVADRLTRKPNVRLVMLGGLYHPASASFFGATGLEMLDQLVINVAFLSAAGVDARRGATCAHFHEAEIKKKAMSRARKNILLADSSKIGKLKPAFFSDMKSFDVVITENGMNDFD
ncbi:MULTISPECIES: DeoR family transcriptional regulator [Rhizobium]|jgi:DeoR family deoxyribose operon repressor|uniref:DeoR family transcriptional regulator n=1 Tax=Rhizobium TaxID=379 RepID=UPI000522E833|nr:MULTISPECIES: DeoR family transcriptional regulator [Rhizobium]KPN25092.1 DeoR family transcriptional regulator [Rhizobium brockwellii]MDV4157237.1 DeoR family transcriptional regulator [Rhizobium brockwellii]QJX05567.1 DeoR family transcriptional regulator [Rhizobium brockwellii]TAX39679.1 DeoR family transcriptional regulator [Rhizobium leguminosarum]TAX92560.1 DeoR family transcriptional regulator [Rhizobium leguminosarum]